MLLRGRSSKRFVLCGFVFRSQHDLVVEDLIKDAPGYSPQFEEVLRGCLQPRPESRFTPEQLLELEWFQRFRCPAAKADGNKETPADGTTAEASGESTIGGATVTERAQGGVTSSSVESAGDNQVSFTVCCDQFRHWNFSGGVPRLKLRSLTSFL